MPPQRNTVVLDMPPPGAAWAARHEAFPLELAKLDAVIFWGMLALLMWAPLAFGTTEVWSQFIQQVAAITLFTLWAVRQVRSGVLELTGNPLYWPALLFGFWIAIQFFLPITQYRYATEQESLHYLIYGILLLIAGETVTSRGRFRALVFSLAVFGFVLAVFAIVQDLSGTDKIYWLRPTAQISASIFGPYANHNHYAGLMEMLVPLAGAAAFLERGGKQVLLIFATVMMAVSIVFSRSRGGVLALAVSVVFACVVLFRGTRRKRPLLALLAVSALVAVLVFALGTDRILDRFAETQDSYRLAIYRDCLHMFLQKPLAGFGFGAFPTVYPSYKTFYTNLFVNQAHSDYLQLLVETGLVGFAIALWFLWQVFRSGFKKISDRRLREEGILTIGVLTGIVALLVHSALDFNLHVPANAALFYVLCAVAATPIEKHSQHTRSFDFDEEPHEL